MSESVPRELQAAAAIANQLGNEIDCCLRLLKFGVELLSSRTNGSGDGLRQDTVITASGLYVKATTSFAASVQLCKAGLDRSAMPVNRSLFETALTLAFLLRRRVSLYLFNDSKTKPRTPVALHGKKLTTSFRTELYAAWCALMDDKKVQRFTKTAGIKRRGTKLQRLSMMIERPYFDAVGPHWEAALRKSNTCSGLSIENLAKSIGEPYRLWHGLVYSSDSQHVHQSDVIQFLNADIRTGVFTPRWSTSPEEIRSSLHKAATLYVQCIIELIRRLCFPESAAETVRKFSQELREWSLGGHENSV